MAHLLLSSFMEKERRISCNAIERYMKRVSPDKLPLYGIRKAAFIGKGYYLFTNARSMVTLRDPAGMLHPLIEKYGTNKERTQAMEIYQSTFGTDGELEVVQTSLSMKQLRDSRKKGNVSERIGDFLYDIKELIELFMILRGDSFLLTNYTKASLGARDPDMTDDIFAHRLWIRCGMLGDAVLLPRAR